MAAVSVHTVEEPEWIQALLELLANAVTPHEFFGPLSYRLYELNSDSPASENPTLAVLVFPTPFELCYGPVDGGRAIPGFTMDVRKILSGFSVVNNLAWHVPAKYNGDLDGPELRIAGSFAGRRIWLRFFTVPPPSEPVSHVYEPATGRFWER